MAGAERPPEAALPASPLPAPGAAVLAAGCQPLQEDVQPRGQHGQTGVHSAVAPLNYT